VSAIDRVVGLIRDELASAQLIVQMGSNPRLAPFERAKTYADACRAYDALFERICNELQIPAGLNASLYIWPGPDEDGSA
jgi:hypothetical protein